MKQIQRHNRVACFKRWNRMGYAAFASLKRQVMIGVLSVGMTLISLASGGAKAAQAADSLEVYREVELQDVGVTHSKGNPTRSASLPTPIFSRKAESKAPVQSLESALRLSPAVDVRERGGKGVQADISVRGGSFDQTQVMLNGINFTDARTGHQTHSLPVDIESVAGIELIDGVSGVGAYAGAINIRTAPLEPTYMRFEMSLGDYGYNYSNVSGSYTKGKFNIFGMGSFRGSDGYAYNTSFENWNGYLRSTYDSKVGFFDAQLGYQKRAFGSNGFYSLSNPDQYETTQTIISSLRFTRDIGECMKLNSSVSYRKNFDDYEWIRNSPVGNNLHNTDNATAELYADYKWQEAGTTTLGADYTYNHIWSTNMGEEVSDPKGDYTHADERSIGNFYLRHTKEWDKFGATASAGYSATPYGSTPIWSLSGRYKPLKGLVMELGANQSMRLPTFTDLYYNNPTRVADENLLPEEAITYRFTAAFTRGDWSTNGQIYLRDGSNIIDWAQTAEENAANPNVYYSRQITSLKTLGFEWMGTYAPECFVDRVTLSYGHISQDKESGEMISLYAQNYMQNKAAASVTLKPHKNISLVVTASYFDRYGNYTDAKGQTTPYDPYFLLDARAEWAHKGYRVYCDIMNITSTEYQDYGGLTMPPCWASAGISFLIK